MKQAGLTLVVCAFLGACASQPVQVAQGPTPIWFMTAEKCDVWDPMPVDGETASWSGACVGGFAEGKGKLIWKVPYPPLGDDEASYPELKVSSVFQGQMQHGFEQGAGLEMRFYPSTGKTMHIMNGNFKDSLAEGSGTILTARGTKYVGNFHLGREEGHGRLTLSSGDTYDGEFHLGVPDGLGKFIKVRPGALNSPQMVLDGSWQKGCFVSQSPYACPTLIKP